MNLGKLGILLKKGQKIAIKKAPTLMAVGAIGGTVATGIAVAKGTLRAKEILAEHEMDDCFRVETDDLVYYREPTWKEKVKLTWKCFVPAAGLEIATVGMIIGSDRINVKRNAELIAAYSVSDQIAREFREKVTEKLGESKVKEIDKEIANAKLESIPPLDDVNLFYTQGGDELFFDAGSGRYFRSSVRAVDDAVTSINRKLLRDNMASVNDFYDYLGLPPILWGNDIGWTSYNYDDAEKMVIEYDSSLLPDQRACIVIRFEVEPLATIG